MADVLFVIWLRPKNNLLSTSNPFSATFSHGYASCKYMQKMIGLNFRTRYQYPVLQCSK